MLQLGVSHRGDIVALAAAYDSSLSLKDATPRELQKGLTHLLRQGRFIGREVVVGVPNELVRFKSIRIPPMEERDLISAAEFEAKALFDATPENSIIGHVSLGQVRQAGEARQEVLIAAAERSGVDQLIESLHAAQVVPVSVDFRPCMLYRTIERFVRRKDDEAEVHVLIDVSTDCVNVLIGRGRDLCFFRPLASGMRVLDEAVARTLGIEEADARLLCARLSAASSGIDDNVSTTDDVRMAVFDATRGLVDELAREISLCLRYATVTFRGLRPFKARLTGIGADHFVIKEVLGRSLPIPVEQCSPILNADLSLLRPADRTGNLSVWTSAMGLALRFVPGGLADKLGLSRTLRSEAPASEIAVPAELEPHSQANATQTQLPSRTPSSTQTPTPSLGVNASSNSSLNSASNSSLSPDSLSPHPSSRTASKPAEVLIA